MDVSNTTEEMTAIEKLRAELTKRGVKWGNPRPDVTRYIDKYGVNCRVMPWTHDAVKVELYCLTPAQAIAITLGAETCKLVETEHEQEIDNEFGKGTFSYWAYDCSECGHENAEYGRFCAGCGRKVVDEWRV